MHPGTQMPSIAAQTLQNHWKITQTTEHTRNGIRSVRHLARCMDTYFSQRSRELGYTNPPLFSILAVGGYGRRELCLGSDIDVLLIHAGREEAFAAEAAQEFFTPLWDLNFTLGHGVMTVSQCLDLARTDTTFLTSLLDARRVTGSRQISETLLTRVDALLTDTRRRELSQWLIHGYTERYARHEGTGGMLEPDIKEGIGGIRDCNLVHWLAVLHFKAHGVENLTMHGLLSPYEKEALTQSLSHIFLVRNTIHALAKRPGDRLHFDLQQRIAETLGYVDTENEAAVERFLAKLHRSMAEIRILCRFFIRNHIPSSLRNTGPKPHDPLKIDEEGETLDVSRHELLTDPLRLMEIFAKSAASGRLLSWKTRHRIIDLLYLVDDTFRQNPRVRAAFEKILMAPRADSACTQMLETGFLGTLIPEFGVVQDRVQFDAYHLFPVGAHSIRTLKLICTCTQDHARDFFPHLCRFSRDKTVRMAALLHDIGKTGPNHAARSAALTDTVLKRFGWEQKKRNEVIFLIANHLLLVHTALRRDLEEESVIQDLAFSLQTATRLHKLTLLTWADSKATGPKAWSTWTRTLLQELVLKTQKVIDQEVIAVPLAVQRIAHTRDFLRARTGHLFSSPACEALLRTLPSRYILHYAPEEILEHITRSKPFLTADVTQAPAFLLTRTRAEKSNGFVRLTLITRDQPGLFATITGTLALHDIPVLTASLHRWNNGTVVDTFTVMGPPDPLYQEEAWHGIETTLARAIQDPDTLEEALAHKRRFHPAPHYPHCLEAECVRIDNGGSDFYSIIEMRRKDHPGLLHTIAKALYSADLDVAFAKIATHRDQIQDTFYVRDRYGQKIIDHNAMARIRQLLLESVEHVPCS